MFVMYISQDDISPSVTTSRSRRRSRPLHNSDAWDVQPDTVDEEHIIIVNDATLCCQVNKGKVVLEAIRFTQDDERRFGSLVIGQVFGGCGISSCFWSYIIA